MQHSPERPLSWRRPARSGKTGLSGVLLLPVLAAMAAACIGKDACIDHALEELQDCDDGCLEEQVTCNSVCVDQTCIDGCGDVSMACIQACDDMATQALDAC